MLSISSQRFALRRARLMEKMKPNSLAIISSASQLFRNGDNHFPFRQDSYFAYLTGFHEPDALLILAPDRKEGPFILFNRPCDRDQEIWLGARAGQKGAVADFAADEAFDIHELDAHLPGLLKTASHIYALMGHNELLDELLLSTMMGLRSKSRSTEDLPASFINLDTLLQDLRLIKDEEEIALMRHVADISAQGHVRVMQAAKPGMYEYQLEAAFTHEVMQQGCRALAYPPIVAAGANACVLHYTDNTQPLSDGELLLIDAGGEYQGYAADITRTFPINGRFTKPQRAIYALVLKAQLAGIARVKPGTPWSAIQRTMIDILTQGLVDLGLLEGSVAQLVEDKAYGEFYMHGSGHWLGLDVHDPGAYQLGKNCRELEPGMVLTVEPGLYIAQTNEKVAKQWRGMGVRIEDDVLVTADGHEVLSAGVPKAMDEIEALMK